MSFKPAIKIDDVMADRAAADTMSVKDNDDVKAN